MTSTAVARVSIRYSSNIILTELFCFIAFSSAVTVFTHEFFFSSVLTFFSSAVTDFSFPDFSSPDRIVSLLSANHNTSAPYFLHILFKDGNIHFNKVRINLLLIFFKYFQLSLQLIAESARFLVFFYLKNSFP